jgi:hypothetical protein
VGWALASGANVAAMLFSRANGRGALMLCTALVGLFACAALATSFSLGDEKPALAEQTCSRACLWQDPVAGSPLRGVARDGRGIGARLDSIA